MIDYWLILCQLVPFAQVVLLTAMEYLREEEQEKEETEEDCPETKDYICEEDGEREAKEAWNIPEKKRPEENLVPRLRIIGKFCFMHILTSIIYIKMLKTSQRRKFYPWLSLLPLSSTLGLLQSSSLNSLLLMYLMFTVLNV